MFVSYTQTQATQTLPNRGSHINPGVKCFLWAVKNILNRQATNYDIILSSLVQLCESNERVEQNCYKSEPIGHFAHTLIPNIVTDNMLYVW